MRCHSMRARAPALRIWLQGQDCIAGQSGNVDVIASVGSFGLGHSPSNGVCLIANQLLIGQPLVDTCQRKARGQLGGNDSDALHSP